MRLKSSGSSLLDCMISLAIMSIGMLGLAQLNLQQLKRLTFANEQLRALGSASDIAVISGFYDAYLPDTAIPQTPDVQVINKMGHKILLVNWVSAHEGPHEIALPLP